MPAATHELQDIIHAIACRAIRHDVRTPLGHVQSFLKFLTEAIKVRQSLSDKITGSTRIYKALLEIPLDAKLIDDNIKELENTLIRRNEYYGFEAKNIIQALLEGPCLKLELDAQMLKDSFDPIDQEASEFSTRILTNAKVAKSRLSSLLAFFREDYAQNNLSDFSLRPEAEKAARDISINSNFYGQTFKFTNDAKIYGNITLMQTLLQNIYQNAQKYGRQNPKLICDTTFHTGSFVDLGGVLPATFERPGNDNPWVRADFYNNGPPLPVKEVNAVFRLGKKYAVAGVNDDESQGLGMAICFAVATLHKGLIVADRREAGVCFRLLLPRTGRDGYSDRQLLGIADKMRII